MTVVSVLFLFRSDLYSIFFSSFLFGITVFRIRTTVIYVRRASTCILLREHNRTAAHGRRTIQFNSIIRFWMIFAHLDLFCICRKCLTEIAAMMMTSITWHTRTRILSTPRSINSDMIIYNYLWIFTIRHQPTIWCTRLNKNKLQNTNTSVCQRAASQRSKRRAAILDLIQQLIHTFCCCCSLTDFLMFFLFLFCLFILLSEKSHVSRVLHKVFRECFAITATSIGKLLSKKMHLKSRINF